MQSKATTIEQYLSELPEERRAAIATVRHVILKNLDKDFEEGMQYGMIGFYVPHRIYPAGYHTDPKQPLPFAALASQKDYMSLYMMTIYGEGAEEHWFRNEWAKTGKPLDMGKCCIRFKRLEDLALNVIGEAIRRVPFKRYIEHYESVIKPSRPKTSSPSSTKPAKTKASVVVKPVEKKVEKKSVKQLATKFVAARTAKSSKPVATKKAVKKSTTKTAVKKAGATKATKKATKSVAKKKSKK